MDKCPPAEACRDAFDRMSKATIQMCMSTTGFGPQALGALAPMQHTRQSSMSTSTTYTDTARTPSYLQQQQSRRPIPRFDMDLKDLFSEDETDKGSFSRISNQVNAMRPPPPPVKQNVFTADLKISPQLRSHDFAYSRSQQNQTAAQGRQAFSPPIAQSPSQANTFPWPYQAPYNGLSPNMNPTYPGLGFNDLDFLDSFPVQGSGGGGEGNGNGGGGTQGGMQDVGMGFGMGFGDGTHDWSDGNGFDLFDGFFFGPGGTGM